MKRRAFVSLGLFALWRSGRPGPLGFALGVEKKNIRIKGSETLLPLVRAWAASFMAQNPGIAISAKGGGSGAGINALIRGSVDICASSRPMLPIEIKRLFERNGSLGVSIMCAKDALSIYLNPQNPVQNLTMEQLRGIFSGRIKNWMEVGGPNRLIQTISRQPNSGTRKFLQTHLLADEPYGGADIEPTMTAVIKAVSKDPDAIGYGGLTRSGAIVQCLIRGIEPTVEAVNSGRYPFARYLYFYTASRPEGPVRNFIDFALSPAGQRLVAREGFVPLFVPDDTFD